MSSAKANIKVVVRIRPVNQNEDDKTLQPVITVLSPTALLFDKDEEKLNCRYVKKTYDCMRRAPKNTVMHFDRIFDYDTDNYAIFQDSISPMVDMLFKGYNCSVFAYGATGTGKTFTMIGNSFTPGLMYLTMSNLFQKLEQKKEAITYDVRVCYLEVCNEQVRNLLTKTGPLKLLENAGGVVVSGLVPKPIFNTKDLLKLMILGNTHRTQQPTTANAESSRSHAIFQAYIKITDRKTNIKHMAKLSLVDLAGSERANVTKILRQDTKSNTKVDTSINRSLLALCNCINKLCSGEKHIPFRDSNLTRLLKDSLGGNCKTLMIVNVSKSALAYEDTYNSLMYANRAKNICTNIQQNVVKPTVESRYEKTVKELKLANETLMETNKQLASKVAYLQQTTTSPDAISIELRPWYKRIDEVYAAVIDTHKSVIELQSKIKNLNFRAKLKENTEAFNKILQLNKDTSHSHLARFTTTVSRLAKLIEKNSKELMRLRQKLTKTNKDLANLRTEIQNSEYADILRIYLKSKDLELQNTKKNININHISTINTELVNDSLKMRQAFTMACMILQQSYERLRADGKLCPEMSRNFEELKLLMRSKSISFEEDSEPTTQSLLDFGAMELTASNISELNIPEEIVDIDTEEHVEKVEDAANTEENTSYNPVEYEECVEDDDVPSTSQTQQRVSVYFPYI